MRQELAPHGGLFRRLNGEIRHVTAVETNRYPVPSEWATRLVIPRPAFTFRVTASGTALRAVADAPKKKGRPFGRPS